MDQLLIATNNPGKTIEFQALLHKLPVKLVTPAELGIEINVIEDGSTYAENATRKALAFAHASGILTLADDSGLEVEILNGKPGLHSARFSPLSHATDADRRQYLLAQLEGKPRPWRAQFCCVIAMVGPHQTSLPQPNIHYAQGTCQGEIIPEERGKNGFGYDPIFLLSALNKTMAELTMDEKNRLSHRALAVMNAVPILKEILQIP